jgi:glutamate racemase
MFQAVGIGSKIAKASIAIFDSGMGGLTVLREVVNLMPEERVVYLGDTARAPYGSKSREAVLRYSIENAEFLVGHQIKLLIVACNTASAIALEHLQGLFPFPVVGVIEPAIERVLRETKRQRIGVLATRATVASNAYQQGICSRLPEAMVKAISCPLLAPIVEEGLVGHPVADLMIESYLGGMRDEQVDILLLGCTHYPLLKEKIAAFVGEDVVVIDSAESCATHVNKLLVELGMRELSDGIGMGAKFFVTDAPDHFREHASEYLGDGWGELDVELVSTKA